MAVASLSSFIIGFHAVRKCKPAHINVLVKKLIEKDKLGFDKYLENVKLLQPRSHTLLTAGIKDIEKAKQTIKH